MAQHLPHDILFHIFTNYSSPDQYLNNLMLVCHNWYEITNYEMFWLATLKNILKQQIIHCKNNEKLESLIASDRTNSVIKESDVLKERKSYLSSLEKREKILIIDLKPFTKRRESNDDIYGNSYKHKSVQFIRERRRRMVALEMAQLAIEFENDIIDTQFFQNKWEQILNQVENNKYYDKKVVANLGIFNSSTTIFQIFLKQFQMHFAFFHEGGDAQFYDRVVSFFIYDCGLSVSSNIEKMIKSRGFVSFLKERENNETIFEKFKNEVNFTGKTGVSSHLLYTMLSSTDLKNRIHIEFIRKCIELFKSKKLIKFKENMVEPYFSDIMDAFIPNWDTIELYLKDMNLVECKGFDNYLFLNNVFKKMGYIGDDESVSNEMIVECLKRAQKEFGIKLDVPIPSSLTSRLGRFEILKLLVENGSDINCPPPPLFTSTSHEYHHGVPLASIIYNCFVGSRSDEILYLIEKGATLPPPDTIMHPNHYERYSYADIFDHYFDCEEKYLPTLKILVERFGPRFSGIIGAIENIRYSSNASLSYDGFCERLRYLKQVTNFDFQPSSSPLTIIYCSWGYYCRDDEVGKKEQVREFLENEMGVQLDQTIIEEFNVDEE